MCHAISDLRIRWKNSSIGKWIWSRSWRRNPLISDNQLSEIWKCCMSDQTTKRLLDALAAYDAIKSFLAGQSIQQYKEDYGLRLQIERLLEIIGEALNQAAASD